jgi:hypothetical protein
MYVPDRTFMKRLKEQDPKLGCHFNGRHFVITYDRAYGDPAVIWVVQSATDKGFRQPDQRDLDAIMRSDINNESPKERHQRVAQYMERFRLQSRERARSNFRDLTKDNRVQLHNAFGKIGGVGKFNSAHRRIDPQPSKHAVTVPQMHHSER